MQRSILVQSESIFKYAAVISSMLIQKTGVMIKFFALTKIIKQLKKENNLSILNHYT